MCKKLNDLRNKLFNKSTELTKSIDETYNVIQDESDDDGISTNNSQTNEIKATMTNKPNLNNLTNSKNFSSIVRIKPTDSADSLDLKAKK